MNARVRSWLVALVWVGGVALVAGLLIFLLGRRLGEGPVQAPPVVAFDSPIVTPMEVWPTLEPTSTPPPTPTTPPFPTRIPTPVVTPIPTAAPPIIPDAVGKELQPFWIIYWQGNEVWRIDNEGQERQLLVDTYQSLGQWLTDIPAPYRDTDCCWIGPRVTVSPDGQKVGLVVVDKIEGTRDDSFTFSIYLFDVPTKELVFLSEGDTPVWSPDSTRIAFNKQRGLWIADLKTWQINEVVTPDKDSNMYIHEYTWSPDNNHIAYVYDYGAQRLSEIWLINTEDPKKQKKLIDANIHSIWMIKWLSDGQTILYLSPEDNNNTSPFHNNSNIWSVSVINGDKKQLTYDIMVDSFIISNNGEWLVFPGYQIYDPGNESYNRDLWILNTKDNELLRLTDEQESIGVYGWISGDAYLLVLTEENYLSYYSLNNGATTSNGIERENSYYAIGGYR